MTKHSIQPRWLALAAGAVAASVAVGWALHAVTAEVEDPAEATAYTFVEVAEGEVGSSTQLNAIARWSTTPVGINRAAGVVTTVDVEPGSEVASGTVLYTVDLRPVVVAAGTVPAFRDIGSGTQGRDVEQLQQMLADLGLYGGEINGSAGAVTATAIRAWQRQVGLPQTGVVAAADVIFVPELPRLVTLDSELVHPGATLGGGESVLDVLPAAPEFTIAVTATQANTMPTGTTVEITAPDGAAWPAVVQEQRTDAETGEITLTLSGIDDAPICAESCAQIAVTGQSLLPASVITLAPTSGLVVPSAAVASTADGGLVVVDDEGNRIAVTVIASARGMSIVEGVDAGVRVRIPAESAP